MSDLGALPGVIPYVDHHDGPRRLLTLELSASRSNRGCVPIAGIDGRQYVVLWGRVAFEVPADRNVHVSVHLPRSYLTTQFGGMYEGANVLYGVSMVLPPGPAPASYAYSAGKTLSFRETTPLDGSSA